MANLIPPDAKRAIAIEYWLRVITVWFVLIGCAFIVIAALKLPTFVLVQSQLGAFSGAYEDAQEKRESFEEAQQIISEANDLAAFLAENASTVDLSRIVEELDIIAGSGVSITDFTFQKTDVDITKIEIRGKAETRADLANFRKDLESHSLFDEAVLPISNLAKDKDIVFNITIVPAAQ